RNLTPRRNAHEATVCVSRSGRSAWRRYPLLPYREVDSFQHGPRRVPHLHVRHGEPPTCSSTSPTWVSPWNHTWWSAVPAAPLTLVHRTSWPTSTGNTEPVSCGTRSTTFFATAASSTLTLAAAGCAGAAALVVSCAARPPPASRDNATIAPMRFMTALLQEGSVGRQKLSVVRRGDGDVPATCPAWRRAPCRSPPRPAEISPGTGAAARRTWRRTARPPWRRRTLGS